MRPPVWAFWLYLATTVPWAACLAVYASRAPWRNPDRQVRRTASVLLTQYAALTAVLGYAACVRFFHPSHAAVVVLAFLFLGAVCLAGCWQFANILRLRREARRDRS